MVENTTKFSSTQCLEPHSWNLRVIGFYRLSPAAPGLARQTHGLYMWLVLYLVVLYTLQEVIYTAQVWEDLDKVVAVSFILLTHFDCISKLLVFRFRADRIQALIDKLDGADYLHHRAHSTFLRGTAASMRALLRAYTGAAMFTCLLWAVFPYLDHIQGLNVEFTIWTPGIYDTDESPVFECMLAYTSLQKALQGFANTSMDAFVCAIFALCRTHVTILRFNLECLVEASAEIARSNGETMDLVFTREFNRCMEHYNMVIGASRELQDIFGGVILFQFAVSGWIICMTAYKITDLNPASVEFFSMLLYMSCILTELFIFCYYGNELTIEATYSMRWLRTPPRRQRSTLMFMERARRPVRPPTGAAIPLSVRTRISLQYKCRVLPAQSDRLVEAAYSMRWLRTAPRQQRSTLMFMERTRRPVRPPTGAAIPLSVCTRISLQYKCRVLPAQSDRLVEAAYSMRWLRTPPRQQRSTLMFMERARRPVRPTTGTIIPLSIPTFMKILKSSYSFYALLRETK